MGGSGGQGCEYERGVDERGDLRQGILSSKHNVCIKKYNLSLITTWQVHDRI